MVMATRLIALIALGAVVAGCGGDDEGGGNPLVGVYAVERHDLDEAGCENAVPVVDPANCFSCIVETPYFKVKQQSFFGGTFLAAVDCEAANSCEDDEDPDEINLGGALFDTKEGEGWVGTASAAATGGAACSYSRNVYRLNPVSAGVVRLTRTVHRLTAESPSAQLMGDDCLDLTDNPPPEAELECEAYEEIDARAVEQ